MEGKNKEKLRGICVSLLKNFERASHRRLRKMSERLMRELIPHYSNRRFAITLLAYVLAKIVSKPRLIGPEHKKDLDKISNSLDELAECIDACDDKLFEKTFENVKQKIKNLERSDPRFLLNMINKGKLKIGATMYAQGLSLGTASKLTGIDKHDIQSYAGKTYMVDRVKEEKTIFERLNIARRLLVNEG